MALERWGKRGMVSMLLQNDLQSCCCRQLCSRGTNGETFKRVVSRTGQRSCLDSMGALSHRETGDRLRCLRDCCAPRRAAAARLQGFSQGKRAGSCSAQVVAETMCDLALSDAIVAWAKSSVNSRGTSIMVAFDVLLIAFDVAFLRCVHQKETDALYAVIVLLVQKKETDQPNYHTGPFHTGSIVGDRDG